MNTTPLSSIGVKPGTALHRLFNAGFPPTTEAFFAHLTLAENAKVIEAITNLHMSGFYVLAEETAAALYAASDRAMQATQPQHLANELTRATQSAETGAYQEAWIIARNAIRGALQPAAGATPAAQDAEELENILTRAAKAYAGRYMVEITGTRSRFFLTNNGGHVLRQLMSEYELSELTAEAADLTRATDAYMATVDPQTITRIITELLTTRTQVANLQEFKNYVHSRLDAAGIDKHEAQNAVNGCRIGARLDDVIMRQMVIERIVGKLSTLSASLREYAGCVERGSEQEATVFCLHADANYIQNIGAALRKHIPSAPAAL